MSAQHTPGRCYITKSSAGHYTATLKDLDGKTLHIEDQLPTLDAARASNAEAVLRMLTQHASEVCDHTPDSFSSGVQAIALNAHSALRTAAVAKASAQHATGPCPITPTRLRWLQHLATQRHETPWSKMPKDSSGIRGVTNQTWGPMRDAGLIAVRFGQRHFSEPSDHQFTITDAGRAAIAKATGCAPSSLAAQLATAVDAVDEGHDAFCMLILRGKECSCGLAKATGSASCPR